MCLNCCPKNPTAVILVHKHQQGSRLTLNFKLPHAVMTVWRNQVSFPKPKTSQTPSPSSSHTRSCTSNSGLSWQMKYILGKRPLRNFLPSFSIHRTGFTETTKHKSKFSPFSVLFPHLPSFLPCLRPSQLLPRPPGPGRKGNAFHSAAQCHRAGRCAQHFNQA